MDWRALFRRRLPRIADEAALAEFIDRNAAFLVQKGIYEYSRARAGHYSKVLFAEAGFQEAVEISRWRAYPLGLAMIGELAEGMLRPAWDGEVIVRRERFMALVMGIFDRYPVPPVLGETAWMELRAELQRRLQLIGLHPPKRAIDIPETYAQEYFDLFPIHAKLRSAEFPTTRSYLRITMANISAELEKRLDVSAVAGQMAAALA